MLTDGITALQIFFKGITLWAADAPPAPEGINIRFNALRKKPQGGHFVAVSFPT